MELLKQLIVVAEICNDRDRAIDYGRQAVMLDPTDGLVRVKLLLALRNAEQWAELIAVYEYLIVALPDSSQQYRFEIAECWFALGETGRALEALETYRRAQPATPWVYEKAASLLVEHGRPADAIALLNKAPLEEMGSLRYRIHCKVGEVYAQLGEYEKAVAAYEAALGAVGPDEMARAQIQEALNDLARLAHEGDGAQ